MGAELLHADGRTDRDRQTDNAEANSRFSQFCEFIIFNNLWKKHRGHEEFWSGNDNTLGPQNYVSWYIFKNIKLLLW